MSVITDPSERQSKLPSRRFRCDEYRRLVDDGFFEGDRVELFGGEVRTLAALSEPHTMTVLLARQAIERSFGAGHLVRTRMSLALEKLDSSPEPDLAGVKGFPRDFRRPPGTALLVVEVAVTSLECDLGAKATLYALAGLSDYWVIDVPGRRVVIHREPDPHAGTYRHIESKGAVEAVQPLATSGAIFVADMLE